MLKLIAGILVTIIIVATAADAAAQFRGYRVPHLPLNWQPSRRVPGFAVVNSSGDITAFKSGAAISGVEGNNDTGTTTGSDRGLGEMEKYIFEHVNQYRKDRGLKTLKLDSKLTACARDHSNDMKARNFFSHNSPIPGKTRFTDRAKKFRTTASAENIARDCKNAEAAMQLWLSSPGHLRNIMGPYSRFGIGRKDGYYTQMFGK